MESLKELLCGRFFMPHTLSDKTSLLEFIAAQVAKESGVAESKINKALQAREALGTTGFGNGIAIPHCQLHSLSRFSVGLIVLQTPIPFNAVDGKPVSVVLYIVGPTDQKNEHIRILSNASKLLSDQEFCRRLIAAPTPDALQALINEAAPEPASLIQSSEKMLFQIAARDEKLFNDFLQAAVSLEIENMIVLEGVSASKYLYKLPLFSDFWNSQAENDRKVALISVDKALTNRFIREINEIPNLSAMQDEFALNVIPLYYSAGKLGL